MLYLLIALFLWAEPAQAATYWDSDFEVPFANATGIRPTADTSGAEWYSLNATTTSLLVTTGNPYTGTYGVKEIFTNVNGSTEQPTMTRFFPATTDVFLRFAYKNSSGFQVGSNGITKIMRFRSSGGYPIIWAKIHNGNLAIDMECPYGQSGNIIMMSGVAAPSTTYRQFEMEIKLNSPGVANGEMRLWIDDTLRATVTGRQFIPPTTSSFANFGANTSCPMSSTAQFTSLEIFVQSGLGNSYIDRVAVGNTRIGIVGSPPVADTTAPTPPTSVAAQ